MPLSNSWPVNWGPKISVHCWTKNLEKKKKNDDEPLIDLTDLLSGKVISERLLWIVGWLEETEFDAGLIGPLTTSFRGGSVPWGVLQLIDHAHITSIQTRLIVGIQQQFVHIDHTLKNIRLSVIQHGLTDNINGDIRSPSTLMKETFFDSLRAHRSISVLQKRDCLCCIVQHLRSCLSRSERSYRHHFVSRWNRIN